MEKIPQEVLQIAINQIVNESKITDKATIDIFTLGFIAGSNFTQQNCN